MKTDTIYLIPQSVPCPTCGERVGPLVRECSRGHRFTDRDVGKYFGCITNLAVASPDSPAPEPPA